MKRNVAVLGLVIGIFLPFIGLFIMYYIKFSDTPFGEFIKAFFANREIAAKVLTLSILVNLLPFIYYTNRRLDYTAKGILIATMLYAVLIIMLKFV